MKRKTKRGGYKREILIPGAALLILIIIAISLISKFVVKGKDKTGKKEKVKQNQVVPEKVKHPQVIPEKVKHPQVIPEKVKQNQVIPEKVKQNQVIQRKLMNIVQH